MTRNTNLVYEYAAQPDLTTNYDIDVITIIYGFDFEFKK